MQMQDTVSFITPGSESATYKTIGWEFTPTVDTWADKLDFYDSGHNGLSQEHGFSYTLPRMFKGRLIGRPLKLIE